MGREPQRPAIPRAEWLLIDLILTYGLRIVILRTEKMGLYFFPMQEESAEREIHRNSKEGKWT